MQTLDDKEHKISKTRHIMSQNIRKKCSIYKVARSKRCTSVRVVAR